MRVRGADCRVSLFQHTDFSGWEAGPLDEGDYKLGDLKKKHFINDDMSSLKVWRVLPVPDLGNTVCTVIVYQHADFTGW